VPIYEFRCLKCNFLIEVTQKYNDPFPKCRKCGEELERTISLGTFRLKGDGWYKDGYTKKVEEK
jgi:putative FmdB family regulatory protein|tara:strand:- start:881 stop:1072 length:192 start_codon:yes stop_codon:yes gene_type:complete